MTTRLRSVTITIDIETNKSDERYVITLGEDEDIDALVARLKETIVDAIQAEIA